MTPPARPSERSTIASIPERRSRTWKRRGILLIVNHEHVTRVLAYRAEIEGEAA